MEPVILDSLLAISTLYEHPQFLATFRDNASPTSASNCDEVAAPQNPHFNDLPPPDEFHANALRLYNRAIRGFQQRMKEGQVTPLLALLSCALFSCIEVIRDDVFAALSLFERGNEMLNQYASTIAKQKDQAPYTLIKLLFARLGVIAATLGHPTPMDVPTESVVIGQHTVFATLADARTALFALMADSHAFIKDANRWKESFITTNMLNGVTFSNEVYDQDILETMYGARFRTIDRVSFLYNRSVCYIDAYPFRYQTQCLKRGVQCFQARSTCVPVMASHNHRPPPIAWKKSSLAFQSIDCPSVIYPNHMPRLDIKTSLCFLRRRSIFRSDLGGGSMRSNVSTYV